MSVASRSYADRHKEKAIRSKWVGAFDRIGRERKLLSPVSASHVVAEGMRSTIKIVTVQGARVNGQARGKGQGERGKGKGASVKGNGRRGERDESRLEEEMVVVVVEVVVGEEAVQRSC